MNNDFNTAVALSSLYALADKIASTTDASEKHACVTALRKLADVLGLRLQDNRKALHPSTANQVIDMLLEVRQNARANKDFSTSDLIRKRLTNLGINVMDTAGGGTSWELI